MRSETHIASMVIVYTSASLMVSFLHLSPVQDYGISGNDTAIEFVTYSLKSKNEFVPCQRINAFAFDFTFYSNDVFMYKPVL